MQLNQFLGVFATPITFIGATVLLILRIGWPGFVGIVLILLAIPLSNCISKRNGGIF
jgi:hypothetical protein